MVLQLLPLLLLWAVLGSLVPVGRPGSSRHSLCYSCLKVSEPIQGLPQFLSVIHLDDQPITRYDNMKLEPLVPWMEPKEAQIFERRFRAELEWLSNLNHRSAGLHTWQVIWGCELKEDGNKGGFFHYGYDGRDFISFDKETLRWLAAQPQAEKVKQKWEDDPGRSQANKDFLEKTCIEWLQRYLSYQKEALKKTESPVGKVTRKVVHDRLEVLICQAFGFYPKEIQATWTRDGEACKYETLHRNVAPNSDGTYYVQLSIEIDPKEREHFRCHLEHDSLQEPLVLAFKEGADTSFIFEGIMIILVSVNLFMIYHGLKCRRILRQGKTTCLDHLPSEILCSSTTSGTEDENRSATMLPPKRTSEGCCGQKTELREGEKTPLSASLIASSDNEEGPSLETSEGGLAECLEDAEATKPGMEGLEEEMNLGTSAGPSEEQPDDYLARKGERRSCTGGLTDPARSPGWRRIAVTADQEGGED